MRAGPLGDGPPKLRRLLPVGGLAQVREVAEIGAGGRLGGEDDLAGVLGEVLDNVVDGFEHGDILALDADTRSQACRRKDGDDGAGLAHGGAEAVAKFVRAEAAAGGEFRIAIPHVRCAAHTRDDPLPQIAGQMQNQVAGCVLILASAKPELLRAEPADAIVDARSELIQPADGAVEEDAFQGGFHSSNYGIEAFGVGHRFFNNQIQNNLGWGILLRARLDSGAAASLDSTIVSGYDPFCAAGYPLGCTFVPHYITNNAGCWTYGCYGSGWPADMAVAGLTIDGTGGSSSNNITLDHVRVTNSGRYGLSLTNLTGGPGFTDSQNSGYNYACVTGNSGGDLHTSNVASDYTFYTNLCP